MDDARERDVLDREEFDEALSEVGMTLSGRYEQMLSAHDAAQRAEIEQYREALEKIAEETGTPYGRIAHRALNEGEDDG